MNRMAYEMASIEEKRKQTEEVRMKFVGIRLNLLFFLFFWARASTFRTSKPIRITVIRRANLDGGT